MTKPHLPEEIPIELSASDEQVLHHFGYAQQLFRDMGGFSNFALSFSVISILTGAVTLYGQGITSGGPVVMGIGWPLVTFFVLCVSACLAELASAIPTSGALYHWSSIMGGPTWGWFTAWFNLIGLIATVAGIDYGAAQFLAPLIGIKDNPSNLILLMAVIVTIQAMINHIGIRAVARINDISAIYHIAGVLIIVLALTFWAPKQPVSFLFTHTFTTLEGKPYWICFFAGLLQAQWTYTGYDASAHAIEETKEARIKAPWGILLSVAVSGIFGYLMLSLVTLAIHDLPKTAAAPNPFVYIFETSMGPSFARFTSWLVTIAMLFCGLSCITSTSRMIFAFSRDKGLPLSTTWSVVSPKYRTPAAAIWLGSLLAVLLPAFIFAIVRGNDAKMASLYPAVTGISAIALYISYGTPLILKLREISKGRWTAENDGPWNLGKLSKPLHVVSIIWIFGITVLFTIPPNELTGYIFGGAVLFLILLFQLNAKNKFVGPIPQATSTADFGKIESVYQQPEYEGGTK